MPMYVYACMHARTHPRTHTDTPTPTHTYFPPPHTHTHRYTCQKYPLPTQYTSLRAAEWLFEQVHGIPFVPTKTQIRQPATSFGSDCTPPPHTKENTLQHGMYTHKPCTYLLHWVFIVSTTTSSVLGGKPHKIRVDIVKGGGE